MNREVSYIEAVGKPLELESACFQKCLDLIKLVGSDNQIEVEADQWVYIGVDPLPTDYTILNVVLLQHADKLV